MNTQLKTDPLPAGLHPLALEGIELFNRGRYYEAHDPLEEAWMETQSPERDLYQGILQIGLAYYQISRGNYRGALKMFKWGQRNLENLGESMMGINITQLIEDSRAIESILRDLGDSQVYKFNPGIIKQVPLID